MTHKHTEPVVTVTILTYNNIKHKVWGMRQMRDFYGKAQEVPGLTFKKLLGSGGGNGFSIWPNFSRYVLMACWESEAHFENFRQSVVFQEFAQRACAMTTVYLKCIKSHGLWDKQQPFILSGQNDATNMPMAVLTRATIANNRLMHFWKHVPSVSRSIEGRAGLVYAVGVGEYPIFQQATFSVWQNFDSMRAYAYQGKLHSGAIQNTRKYSWYSEELFARFIIYKEQATIGPKLLG